MTRQEKVNLLNELLGIEEKNDIGNLTSTDRREFQQWVEELEQDPKTGHWIENITEDSCDELFSYWECSECGRTVGHTLANIADVLNDYPYCHCGAKMVEP